MPSLCIIHGVLTICLCLFCNHATLPNIRITFFGVFFFFFFFFINDEEGRICVCKSEGLFQFHFFYFNSILKYNGSIDKDVA